MQPLNHYLNHLPTDLIQELEHDCTIKEFDKETEILGEGQYVKLVPVVLEGIVKVFTGFGEKELLLYYIESGESCIMSFNASMHQHPSKIVAIAESKTVLLLLPAEKLHKWTVKYPSLNQLFISLYNQRYESLLDTINHLLYHKLDERLYSYLVEKSKHYNTSTIKTTHKQIAAELGTAREVISRVMKKLEHDGKVKQLEKGIKIF